MAIKKIVVFSGNLAYSVRKGIVELDECFPGLSWLIVVHAPRKKPAQILRSQWLNLKRNGWRWIPYQAGDVFQQLYARKKIAGHGLSGPGQQYTYEQLISRNNVAVVKVKDIHAETTIETVKRFDPDLGLSLAAPILRQGLFSIPKLGTLNLHKGKVPDYRGMPPAFWELWNNESQVGCTVHWVDASLDTGAIAGDENIDVEKYSTVRGLQLCLDEIGINLMCKVVQDIDQGVYRADAQRSGGRTNRKPTLKQVDILERRLRRSEPTNTSSLKRTVKDSISAAGYKAWELGLSRVVRPRITVLLYHRVSDDVRDNLTVGVEQFDRQMAILRKHCRILSIEDVVHCDEIKRDNVPLVCVTFDDGYLDNYTNAAQILMRHQIPGAFFVSTGIVGTDLPFPHDLRRGGKAIPVMDWSQVQKMHEYGFTIGSHSVSHIDCVAEPANLVRAELDQSLNDLRERLNLKDVLFAYPYGGRKHMTPERLELVKKAGYVGCLSAYGGTNVNTVDRFNVLRRGIHWEFSDDAFLFATLGLS